VISLKQEPTKGSVYVTTTTVRKWGNSLAVRIPQEIAEIVKFADGVDIELYVTEDKQVVLRPAYPSADDQEALRKHFLMLRAKCRPGMSVHEDTVIETTGDEIV
jgi:antitoxin component of MazEF toxin-antitoxin module